MTSTFYWCALLHALNYKEFNMKYDIKDPYFNNMLRIGIVTVVFIISMVFATAPIFAPLILAASWISYIIGFECKKCYLHLKFGWPILSLVGDEKEVKVNKSTLRLMIIFTLIYLVLALLTFIKHFEWSGYGISIFFKMG